MKDMEQILLNNSSLDEIINADREARILTKELINSFVK